MVAKITPTKKVKRFEMHNCAGKLRVDVKVDDGEISEVILMTKKGGCKYNLQLIGRMITSMLECNIDIHFICSILDANDPCPAPTARSKREELKDCQVGHGGCSKIIMKAIQEKLDGLQIKK